MTVTIRHGDCREVLKTLPDQSVHCCVTSPPYFGLRDYGTAKWDGGDAECDHLMPANGVRDKGRDRAASGGKFHDSPIPNQIRQQFSGSCGHCGATRIDSQIGLEATPDAFVAEMVAVFAEVKRVLRDDGTLWLNLGDSYASSQSNNGGYSAKSTLAGFTNPNTKGRQANDATKPRQIDHGVKAKDLIGIPWRVAFAMQADGWYLRQDIIWSKPNPMPESVTDRCTKAHEYIFLLSKSARYFYDAGAISETALTAGGIGGFTPNAAIAAGVKPSGNMIADRGRAYVRPETRNKRSVWEVTTQPFADAHFATFPPDLIEPCIKAGCPEKACSECGAPWQRDVEKTTTFQGGSGAAGRSAEEVNATGKWAGKQYGTNLKLGPVVSTRTLGFAPSCQCNAGTVGGTVLDPFGGAGTTGLVADRLGRNAILIELNPDYAAMAQRRIEGDGGMFAAVNAL